MDVHTDTAPHPATDTPVSQFPRTPATPVNSSWTSDIDELLLDHVMSLGHPDVSHQVPLHHPFVAPDTDYLHKMMDIYQQVRATGQPNYLQAKIALPRSLNITEWSRLLATYHDKELLGLLTYGFPLGYEGPIPIPTYQNHMSATCYPDHVRKYIQTEVTHGTMLGAFDDIPFTWAQISPLMTRPKKGTSDSRRTIVDLSFPPLASVNYFTPSDTYCGEPRKVHLPSADDLIHLINGAGPDCYLYSTDISRAYRHLPLDPLSWPLTCIQFDSKVFCDISLPFGARWSASACQRTTDAVCYIMSQNGHTVLNYIDDFCGIAFSKEEAEQGFKLLQTTLAQLGLPEAVDKACPPSRCLTWLGVEFDCE